MGCHRQFRGCILCGAWLFLSGPLALVRAESEEPSPARVQQLVEQLGAGSFVAREAATRQLTAIGPAAKDALLAVLRSGDAETRTRARRILEIVLERDFQRRLRAFAADDTNATDYGLPCWQRFRETFGNEPATRHLFVEMQRGEPALLDVADGSPELVAETLESRMRQMQEEAWDIDGDEVEVEPSAGRAAAIMFVAADANVQLSEETASYVAGMVYQTPFQQAISSGPTSVTMRKLLGIWVRKGLTAGIGLRAQNMMMAQQFELPETLELALSLISDEAMEPYLRPYAVMAVAKFGQKEHLSTLSKLLEDESPCGEYDLEEEEGETVICQVRDAALAAMICLTGQSLADYGFEGIENSDALDMELSELGFKNQEQRDRAFAQWKTWAAEHPLP